MVKLESDDGGLQTTTVMCHGRDSMVVAPRSGGCAGRAWSAIGEWFGFGWEEEGAEEESLEGFREKKSFQQAKKRSFFFIF